MRPGRAARWTIALLTATGALTAAPAHAAAHASVTKLHVQLAASFHVGGPVLVTGTVTPKSSAPVVLQRLVGTKWVPLTHAKPSTAGVFSLTVKASKSATTWKLRAVRARSGSVKAAVSAVVVARLVKAQFTVTAGGPSPVTLPGRVVVTGKVGPKSAGSVVLQGLVGTAWHNLGSAKLTKSATYAVAVTLAAGTHRLRVSRPATKTTAAGLSRTISVVVVAVVVRPSPVITSTVLPAGIAELPFLAQLSASGGTAPYTWVVTALPAGLTATSAGAISGTVAAPVTVALAVTVTDAAGTATTGSVSLVIALSPQAHNSVVGWGTPEDGSLGSGTSSIATTPLAIPGVTGAVALAASNGSAFALRFDGTVWAWGSNVDGVLGDNFAAGISTTTPEKIPGLIGITAIAAGSNHAMALRSDGTVWGWGENASGEIGDGTNTQRDFPVRVANLTGVTAIAAGFYGGFALKSDGTVWSWGDNALGTLGTGGSASSLVPVQVHGITTATAIAANYYNGAALLAGGTVWEWGRGSNGEIGGSSTANALTPVQVGGVAGVTQLVLGGGNGYVLESDGSLWTWGPNGVGQLGVADIAAHTVPVKVNLSNIVGVTAGLQSVVARLDNGTAWSWGYAGNGQLGNGKTATDESTPVQVTGLSPVVAGGTGNFASYAIISAG